MSQTFYIARHDEGIDGGHQITLPKNKWDRQRPYDTQDDLDLQWLAEELAKRYYDDCDGWDWWKPNEEILFEVFDEKQKSLGVYNIILEFEPSFTANKPREVA